MVLYGMLCGTLPYDDDQHRRIQQAHTSAQGTAAPDTDRAPLNVRKLYEYIVSAPLQFPTGICVDILAVDLIRGMLCSDPGKRLNIQEIWLHPWLSQ